MASEEISSNIIVVKQGSSYSIRLENSNILSILPKGFAELIDKMLKINNKNLSESNGIVFRKLIDLEENQDIINTDLFINIYTWFTNLGMRHLPTYYKEVRNINKDNLVIVNGEAYEYPPDRESRQCDEYYNFKLWLYKLYSTNKVTFNSLFNVKKIPSKNTLDIITSNVEKTEIEINILKFMMYKDYLQTHHWKETRENALIKSNYKCALCNSIVQLNVHHKTYENRGNEKPEDLIVLCRNCHAKFHDKLDHN